MNVKTLDFRKCKSCQDVHDVICDGLSLPVWYGRNLDALWDMVTGYIELPMTICIWKPQTNNNYLLDEINSVMSIFYRAIEQDYELTILNEMG